MSDTTAPRRSRRGRKNIEPAEVAGLASTRTFPLKSSFAPSYNMTINLVNQFGPTAARALLERSFAQYQADRSVVGLVRGVERGEKMLPNMADKAIAAVIVVLMAVSIALMATGTIQVL